MFSLASASCSMAAYALSAANAIEEPARSGWERTTLPPLTNSRVPRPGRAVRRRPVCGEVCGSGREEALDGAAFVHRLVALGDLVQGQGEVEDLAGIDPAGQDAVDQVGQVAAYGGGAAAQADVGEEQLLAVDLHLVRDADEADVAAGPGGAQGLLHGLGGADALQYGVGADAAGEVPDAGDAFFTAFGDDVGGAEFEGELLPGCMAAHGDDPLGAEF